jgi:hypothetical protein
MARRKNGGAAKEKIDAKRSGAARRGGEGARHTGARAKRSLISRLKFW